MREIDRLSLMVNELLLLSQAASASFRRAVDLGSGARAAERWRATAAEKGIDFVASRGPARRGLVRDPGPRSLAGPAGRERAAYSPAGAGEAAGAPGRVAVLDQGPGLAPARRRRCSSASAAAAPARRGAKGTGLGLSIARELTRRWGGEVRLRRDGGGLAATIESSPAEVRS